MQSVTSVPVGRGRFGGVVVVAALWGLSLVSASCTSSSSSPASRDASDSGMETSAQPRGSIRDDLARMQGTWERQIRPEENLTYKRCVKELGDGRETVTYYDAAGQVTRQHTVDFKLEQHGPARLFTFWNQQITAGPEAGKQIPERRSYLYRISGDELAEVWGFLPGQEDRPISYHTHRRIKGATAASSK
jgi:YD repeat-containing protein